MFRSLDLAARKRLLGEVLKFGIVGAFDTVLHFGLFNLLHYTLGWEALIANGLAIIVAVTSSYLLNRHWTFSHRARSGVGREYTVFVILNAIGWVISQICLGIARYLLDLTDPLALNAALVVGVGIGAVFRFATYKRFVFLSPERAAARRARGAPAATPLAASDTDASTSGSRTPVSLGWPEEQPAADTKDD